MDGHNLLALRDRRLDGGVGVPSQQRLRLGRTGYEGAGREHLVEGDDAWFARGCLGLNYGLNGARPAPAHRLGAPLDAEAS